MAVLTISNTVSWLFAPPFSVVPNRSPALSSIKPAKGRFPFVVLKLTNVISVATLLLLGQFDDWVLMCALCHHATASHDPPSLENVMSQILVISNSLCAVQQGEIALLQGYSSGKYRSNNIYRF